ncbi:DUF806 family protein [Lactobacillus helveticus]|uniref:DUF806 family protein n=1 Tax=Lactobacillus helveticus TaxID=1587 RepID=UPI001563ED8A|nr:DUF806 family protein [Lactobacillus helveticus]NRO84164.1 hypothetical protein [Lactobacillus helveticus]NRO92836.1 hypothetical protein [Lactobacillus helveticus]
MTIVYELSEELNKAGIKDLDHAHPFRIPPSSLVKCQDKALIAVSEVMDNPAEHGSNTYNEMSVQVQIKICYPIGNNVNNNLNIDADVFEKSIASFFMQKNWLRQASSGHYMDDSGHAEIDLFFKRRF